MATAGKWYYSIEHKATGRYGNGHYAGQFIAGCEAEHETKASAKRAADGAVERLLESGWLRSQFTVRVRQEA